MLESQKDQIPFRQHIPRFPEYVDLITNKRVLPEPRAKGLPTARTSVLFNPQLALAEPGELPKVQKLNFFVSGLEMSLERSNDYLDVEEAEREVTDARRRIDEERRRVSLYKVAVDRTTYQRFREIEGGRSEVMDTIIALAQMRDLSYQDLSIKHVLWIGAASLHHHLINRLRDFDHARGYTHQDRLYEFMDWDYSGISMVSIGGVRPIDFVDERVSTRPQFIDAFRFLVEAHLIFEGNNYDQALAETQSELFQRYPNKTKNMLAIATTAITYLTDILVEAFGVDKRDLQSKANAEIVRWAKKYIIGALEVGKAANQVLINPNSPEFLALSREIQGYIAQGRFAELRVLNVLGMKDVSQAKNLYRRARELAVTHLENTAFYTDLADAIKDFQVEMPKGAAILTSDDIPTLLDEEKIAAPINTVVEDIGRAVVQIHPSAYHQSFTLNPDNLNLGVLVKPKSVDVIFDKGKPRNFRVKLTYQSPEGETALLECEYQIQKGNQKFELNFLEAQSEIPEMYKAFLQATLFILQAVRVQVEEKRTNTTKAVSLPRESVASIKKKPYVKEDIVEIKTKVKIRPDQPVRFQDQEAQEEIVFEPEKSQMIMDEVSKKRIQKQLERVSYEDRVNIQEAIERFNSGGSIRFYPLKSNGPNGEALFALRAKATAHGGSRILATPIKGTSNFAILAAGYRKDIYRDWGIE
ncbi:hypothetical protein A3I48_04340 [Candidatus Daviesbacteria bacterium RIFCSPLOWO2_02_FULL_36_7]|uniref:Uncharacterized protein n=1 Tax=Candidatus Daviesbacteria bacterium RIFCSPLOWO2_02_FULL_36_7 TaxID=1797792 RepID=A0A1F5MHZ1_9BACT|nr:MAG: hypothetical protein A3I48_04340 [Candidatus Daviesbacteria bacterium RIFCSPLOWO2_02_FULL_36_7]